MEEENRALQAEYERLKSEQPSGSISDEGSNHRSEAEMLAEAKLLREHKGRLEARMAILEDHNRQLEAQLQRLRQLLVEASFSFILFFLKVPLGGGERIDKKKGAFSMVFTCQKGIVK